MPLIFVVIAECIGEDKAADGCLLLGRWEHLAPVFVAHLDEVSDCDILVMHLLAIVVVEDELALRCVFQLGIFLVSLDRPCLDEAIVKSLHYIVLIPFAHGGPSGCAINDVQWRILRKEVAIELLGRQLS